MNDPTSDPMQTIDPIHDSCELVSGPDRSGVSSESSRGIAGDIQPTEQPFPSITRFATCNHNSVVYHYYLNHKFLIK